MIGSHNSLTYLPAKTLVGKLLMPWTRCQNRTLVEQYIAGTRYFDIRVRFNNGKCEIVHNKIVFKGDALEELEKLSDCIIHEEPAYIRIILDVRQKPKDAAYQKRCFRALINDIEDLPGVEVTIAIIYWNWEYIRELDTLLEYHASVSSPWYDYIRGIKYCAKKLGKPIKYKNTTTLIDYV